MTHEVKRWLAKHVDGSAPSLVELVSLYAYPWEVPGYSHTYETDIKEVADPGIPGGRLQVEGFVVDVYDVDVSSGVPDGLKPRRSEVLSRDELAALSKADSSRRSFRAVIPEDVEPDLVFETDLPGALDEGYVELSEQQAMVLKEMIASWQEDADAASAENERQMVAWRQEAKEAVAAQKAKAVAKLVAGTKLSQEEASLVVGDAPTSLLPPLPAMKIAEFKPPTWLRAEKA